MNSHSVYILEDEIITQELLRQTLESLNFSVCGTQVNAKKALKEIKQLQPDIVFLDIRVEGDETGIWLGEQLNIPFIYLTAFTDAKNIKDAIKTQPVSYLKKPFSQTDLFIALELAVDRLKEKKQLFIKEKNVQIKINVNDILFATKDDHYIILYVNEGKKIMRANFKQFLEQVTSDFMQVHRSFVINKTAVTGISSSEIIINEHKIPVSQSFLKKVKDEFNL